MKKIIIIIFVAIAVTGGILFTVGIVKNKQSTVVNAYELTEEYKNITIDVATTDVYFKVSEDGKTKMVAEEAENEKHTVQIIDGVLTITREDNKKWYEKMFDFGSGAKLTLYLPNANDFADLNIKVSTGNVAVEKGFIFDNIVLDGSTGNTDIKAVVKGNIGATASTGDISISETTCKTATIKVSTGKVFLSSVSIDEDLAISSSTGNITLNELTCINLALSVSTGNISLTETVASGKFTASASTGNITFNNFDAETIKITASTGSVRGSIKTDKNFYCTSDTGRVSVPKTDGGLCDIKVSTGDIVLEISK
ncbi:MAG: DUF4097 family beta strand repeat protein [Clostridia bacterium]|nr:DUF4097 family beta strand repeat protein [Clostridia bacterium]